MLWEVRERASVGKKEQRWDFPSGIDHGDLMQERVQYSVRPRKRMERFAHLDLRLDKSIEYGVIGSRYGFWLKESIYNGRALHFD
jgi:hypothetical protein